MQRVLTAVYFSLITLIVNGQIIADHKVVDRYDDIPQYYIDQVKKMWMSYAGESHSAGIREGLLLLEARDSRYSVSVVEDGTPEAYTTANFRASRATWGDLDHTSGWIYGYGEEDWYKSSAAINRTKSGLTYCNTHSLEIAAFGFGWCWDIDETNMTEYLNATQQYVDHCTANGYKTKVYFTTGPVDWICAEGEGGYKKYLAYEAIRTYVKANSSRILFDYADILCYDAGSETPTTQTWSGHTYPVITGTNGTPAVESYHISEAGALRLAKAMWWMMARIAGWDGTTTAVIESEENTSSPDIKVTGTEICISLNDDPKSYSINLYSLTGNLLNTCKAENNLCILNISNLSPGVYLIVISSPKGSKTQKVVIQRSI